MARDSQRAAWTAHVEGKHTPASGSRHKAMGRLKSGERNRTEAAYEQHLELRRQAGEILWYGFEVMTFKLADNVRWTPDFAVLRADGVLECHDTKGTTSVKRKAGRIKAPFIMDDARIKCEVAAAHIPIVFKVVYRVDGNWVEKEY